MRESGQATDRWWPALDGVRGLAVLAVLGFHAGLERFVGGYLGVDVFFALSGFLITTLLVEEFGRTGRIDLRAFWRRRARRILPALVLVIAVTGLLWTLIGTATQRADLSGDVVAAFGFAFNWHQVAGGTGYMTATAVPSPLLHTWSIAIEEQWYLLWPLAVLGLFALVRRTRHGLPIAAGLCVAGALASSALMAYFASSEGTGRAYYGTDTRVAALLLGAGLAFFFSYAESVRAAWLRSPRASLVLTVLGVIGLGGLGIAIATVDHEAGGLYRGGFLLVGLATLSVLAACVHPTGNPVVRLLSAWPLRWVGVISYGLYLWHWPVFLFLTPDRTGIGGTPLLIVRLVVSIALAWACWHLVEQPIRHGRLRARVWLPASAGVVAVAIAVVVVVQAIQPAFQLPEASALRRDGSAAATAPRLRSRPHVFIAGDSIALSLGAGVVTWADHSGRAVVTGHPLLGCGLMDDYARRRAGSANEAPDYCAGWRERWHLEVARQKPDAAILVLSVWDLQEHAIDANWSVPGDERFDAAYIARLDAAVGVLSTYGARVGLLTLPVLRNDEAHAAGTESSIPEEQPRVVGHVNDLLRQYVSTHRGAFLIDLARRVHGEGQHPDTYRGVPLFGDGDGSHFTSDAGVKLAPWIVDQVTRALAPRSGS
jgi:peptidoglycan/LPS O-acetylase OafA/YrhL